MYKRYNEIERLFRRLKGSRRVLSRFEKLDVVFLGFIVFALIVDGLRYWQHAPIGVMRAMVVGMADHDVTTARNLGQRFRSVCRS